MIDEKFFIRQAIWISAGTLIFFVVDRFLKYLAVVGVVFFKKNYGAALSIPFFNKNILSCLGCLMLIVFWFFVFYFFKQKNFLMASGFFCLSLGTMSNLIDRLKFGAVIDYLNFYFFYNNLADILIWLGVIMLLIVSGKQKCNFLK